MSAITMLVFRGQPTTERARDRSTVSAWHSQKVRPLTLARYVRVLPNVSTDGYSSQGTHGGHHGRVGSAAGFVHRAAVGGRRKQRIGGRPSQQSGALASDSSCVFPGAWRLLSVWQKIKMSARATPLPILPVEGLANYFRLQGKVALGCRRVACFSLLTSYRRLAQCRTLGSWSTLHRHFGITPHQGRTETWVSGTDHR